MPAAGSTPAGLETSGTYRAPLRPNTTPTVRSMM
jgi:hypothetical protein